jgi:hypothetical protein
MEEEPTEMAGMLAASFSRSTVISPSPIGLLLSKVLDLLKLGLDGCSFLSV